MIVAQKRKIVQNCGARRRFETCGRLPVCGGCSGMPRLLGYGAERASAKRQGGYGSGVPFVGD